VSTGLPTHFPLRYIRGNLLFGRQPNALAALYRLPMISYPFMSEADKVAWLRQMAGLAFVVKADFSIWRVNRAYPASRYPGQVASLVDGRHADREAWRMMLAGHARHLDGMRAHLPEVYLAVSLSDSQTGKFAQSFLRGMDRARRRFEDIAGVGSPAPLSGRDLEALATAEQRVFERLGFLRPERATTTEIQWLLRRAACRGVAEPDLSKHWRPNAIVVQSEDDRVAYEPLSVDLARTMNAPLHEVRAERESGQPAFWHLVADSEEARTYQAMMVLDGLPEDPTFPGSRAELLFSPLEAVEFPVDAVLHAQWIGNRAALSQVRKGIVDAENVYRDQAEGSNIGPGWLEEENRVLARELEAYLRSESHPPLVKAGIGLAVSAATLSDLRRRVDQLTEQYGDVTLRQPAGMQAKLFYDHALRANGGEIGDWEEVMTIEQFGALMPVGTHRVGSTRGLYIGYTPTGRRPVKFDITEASREARPSAILMAGTLGSGKALTLDTPIPTPDGWRTMGDLRAGDSVFDEHGQRCRVTQATAVMRDHDCYEVVFSDGSTIVADAEHRWLTLDLAARQARKYASQTHKRPLDALGGASRHRGVALHPEGRWVAQVQTKGKNHYLGLFDDEDEAGRVAAAARADLLSPRRGRHARQEPQIRTTEEIRSSLQLWGQTNHAIPVVSAPLAYAERELPIDPYTLGIWLGDGSSTWATIHSADPEVRAEIEAAGYPTAVHKPSRPEACPHFGVGGGLYRSLRELGLLKNKHIPSIYLTASPAQRLSLLQGLMDSDGSIDAKTGRVEFCSILACLGEGVQELFVSLGMKVTNAESDAKLYGRVTSKRYRVTCTPHLPVFRLPRKAVWIKPPGARSPRSLRYIVDVRPVASVPVKCIAVDSPSHLYLAGKACIPTHNTIGAEMLSYLAERRGSLVVDVDPKPDHNFEGLPELAGRVDVIELSGDERYRGVLDPMRIAPEEHREQIVSSYMLDLVPGSSPGWKTAIQAAVQAAVLAHETSSMRVLDRLRTMGKDGKDAAAALAVEANFALNKLGFGAEGEQTARAVRPITTIRTPGLSLPETGTPRADYTREEAMSVATLGLVAMYALALVSGDRTRHKVVLFDEAWFLLASQQGRALFNRLIRLGRALNATIIVATQRLADVGDLENLVGTRFIFGQETDEEAHTALRLLGLDPDDRSRVQQVRSYRKGMCLMRDLHGRVAEVQLDLVFPHLLDTLDTSPKRRGLKVTS